MANLIQATVYQIDGAPQQPSPITLDFRTREVVIREASVPTIPSVQSAILFYNVPNNPLSVQTFYVSESIATLVGDANNAGTSQTQVTVLTINEDPQVPGGVQYSFPSDEILVGEFTDASIGVQAYIQYKNNKYYTQENEAAILAASNNTGVAAGTNPTSLFIPYNNGGIFGDSYLVNDTTASVLKTVYSASEVGLKLDFANSVFKLGNPVLPTGIIVDETANTVKIGDVDDNDTDGTGLIVDWNNALINSTYQGSDIGLKLDFANNVYSLGDLQNWYIINGGGWGELSLFNDIIGDTNGINIQQTNTAPQVFLGDFYGINNGTSLKIEDNPQLIRTYYGGNEIGLKLDFANNSYVLGGINDGYNVRVTGFDPNGGVDIGDYNLYASGTQINLRQELIKTQFNGNDIGLKLDFASNQYSLGDLNANYNFVVDGPNGRCVMGDFNGNVNGTQLEIDDANQVFSLSGNLSTNTAGASSGQFLKIRIGGIDYKIALLNNA